MVISTRGPATRPQGTSFTYLESQLYHSVGADSGPFTELPVEWGVATADGATFDKEEVGASLLVRLALWQQHLLVESLLQVPLKPFHIRSRKSSSSSGPTFIMLDFVVVYHAYDKGEKGRSKTS